MGTNTEITASDLRTLEIENRSLKAKAEEATFVQMIQGNDKTTHFYTGLPTWGMFLHIFAFLSAHVTPSRSMIIEDEMLVRLQLGFLMQDLAYRLKVSLTVASRVCQKWLDVMFEQLAFLIAMPTHEINQRNMPPVFKQPYPSCRCIIDCSEIIIETPTNFVACCKPYSNNKKTHNSEILDWHYTIWNNFFSLPQ